MAVINVGGGKDFFSSILPLVGMLVPGAAPYIAGASLLSGLARGDAGQAVSGGLGLFGGNLFGGGKKDTGLVPMKGNEVNNHASVPIGTPVTRQVFAPPTPAPTPRLTVQDMAGAAGVSPDQIVTNMIGTGLVDRRDAMYYPNWQRTFLGMGR